MFGYWLRRHRCLRPFGAIPHHGAPAAGNHGRRGGEHRDGGHQGGTRKSRAGRGRAKAARGARNPRLNASNLRLFVSQKKTPESPPASFPSYVAAITAPSVEEILPPV